MESPRSRDGPWLAGADNRTSCHQNDAKWRNKISASDVALARPFACNA